MPAPVLRHYSLISTATSDQDVTPAVPAGRALVIATITVTAYSTAAGKFSLFAGNMIAYQIALTEGQQWTERGIVLVAGEKLVLRASVANHFVVSVFGEEVDN